ncbi:MAG: hypothetical protein K1W02_13955 [Muribaculaceae bacterium]|jgi:hypothetical protein
MSRKRLLFISSRPLFPIIGGDQIRTVQQLNFLKEKFDVDVLLISPDKDGIVNNKAIDGVHNIFCFQVSKVQSIIQTIGSVFNRLPLQVNYYYNKSIAKEIDKIMSNYDCVFCNNIRTAEYVREKNGLIKYLDFVDAISMNYDKARREARGLKKLIYEIDYRRCRSYERKCLGSFDSCAVISDVDNQYIISCQE